MSGSTDKAFLDIFMKLLFMDHPDRSVELDQVYNSFLDLTNDKTRL
jgi:hypothetical protein